MIRIAIDERLNSNEGLNLEDSVVLKIKTIEFWGLVRVFGQAQRAKLLDLYCSSIQLYILLSPYLCCIYFLYLDL